MNFLLDQLKNNVTLDSNYFRYALRLLISCSLTVFLYQYLHLNNGYWAAFSVIACVWANPGAVAKESCSENIRYFSRYGVGYCGGA